MDNTYKTVSNIFIYDVKHIQITCIFSYVPEIKFFAIIMYFLKMHGNFSPDIKQADVETKDL